MNNKPQDAWEQYLDTLPRNQFYATAARGILMDVDEKSSLRVIDGGKDKNTDKTNS